MKQTKPLQKSNLITVRLGAALLVSLLALPVTAFERYNDGCHSCHGKFTESISTKSPPTQFPNGDKHEMHNGSAFMNTDCNLCHQAGDQKNPFIGSSDGITGEVPGLGCTGCHVAAALRTHHVVNNVAENCYECHDPQLAAPESVNPPYYGTAYTRANNSCNDVAVANTNENWSVGDFVGLDTDGDNLYDLADFDCGPPYRLLSAEREGSNLRIRWETVGGRVDAVQASVLVNGTFLDVSTQITNMGVGLRTNDYVEIGGAIGDTRFYRIRYAP